MTKHDLLAYLEETGEVDAAAVADAFGMTYAASAMALLRLARQGLVRRDTDSRYGAYTYQLTEHGHARLAFFNQQEIPPARRSDATPRRPFSSTGGSPMKRKKLHTGIYHCPACYIEFDLAAEESLKCDQCHGPLDKGSLDEVWDDDADED